ncbi:MAG: prepilin-type N-terminal cleavage/methylation domain-containing protein [Gammaproteobacteria bacterium]|nr:prepilin-type N-terminal cleavage/methylation domain-containing protein [Gammaproteobacteria bacterium]
MDGMDASPRQPRPARGFALLEVLITLAVSLLALSALIRLQGELIRGDAAARVQTRAALLADQRLETLIGAIAADGPGAVAGGEDTWTMELEPAGEEAVAMYTRAWSVDDAGTSMRIGVRLTWNDHAGARRDILLETLVDPVADNYSAAAWTDVDFIRLE